MVQQTETTQIPAPERGITVTGNQITVAIRFDDVTVRKVVKADAFRWNPEQKIWTRRFPSTESARDYAIRLAFRRGLRILGDDDLRAEYQEILDREVAKQANSDAARTAEIKARQAEVAGTWTITDDAGNTITYSNPATRTVLHDIAARLVRGNNPSRNRSQDIQVADGSTPDASTNAYTLRIALPAGAPKPYATVRLTRTV